jgi:hypothetical protein
VRLTAEQKALRSMARNRTLLVKRGILTRVHVAIIACYASKAASFAFEAHPELREEAK